MSEDFGVAGGVASGTRGARCLDCGCWRTTSESGGVFRYNLRDYFGDDWPSDKEEYEQRRVEKPTACGCREYDCECHQSGEGALAALERALSA